MKVSNRATRCAVFFLGSPSVTDAALRMDSCGSGATWSARMLADLPSAPAPGPAQSGGQAITMICIWVSEALPCRSLIDHWTRLHSVNPQRVARKALLLLECLASLAGSATCL